KTLPASAAAETAPIERKRPVRNPELYSTTVELLSQGEAARDAAYARALVQVVNQLTGRLRSTGAVSAAAEAGKVLPAGQTAGAAVCAASRPAPAINSENRAIRAKWREIMEVSCLSLWGFAPSIIA
ncbi:MAG: hypothetical protein ACK46K_05190, partial [Gammaproteobacteria bacterium]